MASLYSIPGLAPSTMACAIPAPNSFGGMQMSYKYLFDSYMYILDMHQKRKGEGMRWITHIDKENLNLVKIFLKAGIEIRHVKNMPPMNFGVSDKEMAGTIKRMEGVE